ncbi:TPA: exotoxin OB-fold domain-containing protein, partial [Streptococcus pyogenes]
FVCFFVKDWISRKFKDEEVDIYALSAQEICVCLGKRYEAFGGVTLTNSEKKKLKFLLTCATKINNIRLCSLQSINRK